MSDTTETPLRTQATAVSEIALDLPARMTSGDILLALNRAFEAGERWGTYRLNRAIMLDTLNVPTLEQAS